MIIKNTLVKRISYGLIAMAIAVLPVLGATQASAAQITARSVVLGSSAPSASTTYNFTFTAPSGTTVQSVEFKACTAASGACVSPPAGFSEASSTLSSVTGLGSGGTWVVNTATAGSLRASNGSNTGSPSAGATVNFGAVVNPSALNSTFFLRMTTYSAVGFTGVIDTGTVATSTAGIITVNASVDETLTFTLAAASVDLLPAPIGTGAASFGISTMAASTNAASGYTITYSSPNALKPTVGTALPSYSNSASSPGTAGFGINIVDNAAPNVGTNPSGGSGAAVGLYANVDAFTFVGSNVATPIASSGVPTNATTYVVSYVANIAALTAPGAYTTTFTYVATPNF